MTAEPRQILDGYLRSLEAELHDLSPSDRAEIILEVREHFDEARSELTEQSETNLRNILERLGPPAEIAAEARLRFATPAPSEAPAAMARPAAGRLEVGSLVLWVVWWPLGVLLTALSPRWSRRDKAMAVLLELVVLAALLGFLATPAYFAPGFAHLHAVFVLLILLMPPTLAGVIGAAYLVWKLASPQPRAWRRSPNR